MNEGTINRDPRGRISSFSRRHIASDPTIAPRFVEAKAEAADALNLKEILVPVDFTDCSSRALEHAIPLARKLKAKIILLHVVSIPNVLPMGPDGNFQSCMDELRKEANQKFGDLITGLVGSGVAFETRVLEGIPHQAILDFSRERNIEIIVLGHRKGKFWELFRHHTAHCVRERSPALVQVVDEEKLFAKNGVSNPESTTILV